MLGYWNKKKKKRKCKTEKSRHGGEYIIKTLLDHFCVIYQYNKFAIVITDFSQTESDTGADIPKISSDIPAILNHKNTYTMFVKNM